MAEQTLSLFDKEDPRSLVNIVWADLAKKIETIPEDDKYIFHMSEHELRKKVKPDSTLGMLRMRFWSEYDKAQMNSSKIRKAEVISGIVSQEGWLFLVRTPANLAYILKPPAKYMSKMESLLNLAIDEMADILAVPIEDKTGKMNVSLMKEKIRIFELLDLRVKGAIMQKMQIDQRVLTARADPMANLDLTDLNSLEAGIKNVQRQISKMQSTQLLIEAPKEEIKDDSIIDIEKVESEI